MSAPSRRLIVACVLLVGAAFIVGGNAWSQSAPATGAYPNRAVRLVVPAAPSGGTDVLARALAQKLGETWNLPVVVENRAGANGVLASDFVAKSKPDGHTLLVCLNTHVINALVHPKLPFEMGDLLPITLLARYPYVLLVHPSLPARSVPELIALARARPGQLSYASSGNASGPHLGMALFNSSARIDTTHVPYKGSGPGTIDLIAGHVQLMLSSYLSSVSMVRAGRVRLLAVTGARRAAALPDTPTVTEAGIPGYDVTGWYGLIGTAGTPPAVVLKIQADVAAALRVPAIQTRLVSELAEPGGNSSEEFAVFINAETRKWGAVIKSLQLTADNL